jgi:hypothetical protein
MTCRKSVDRKIRIYTISHLEPMSETVTLKQISFLTSGFKKCHFKQVPLQQISFCKIGFRTNAIQNKCRVD